MIKKLIKQAQNFNSRIFLRILFCNHLCSFMAAILLILVTSIFLFCQGKENDIHINE